MNEQLECRVSDITNDITNKAVSYTHLDVYKRQVVYMTSETRLFNTN